MSTRARPTFRREVKRIVEFNTPSGAVSLEQELGQVSMRCLPSRVYSIPEEEVELYIEALQMLQFHMQADHVRGTDGQ